VTGVTLYNKHMGIEIWDGLSDTDRAILEHAGYKTGSMQFQVRYADQTIPAELLTQLVQAQAKRNEAK